MAAKNHRQWTSEPTLKQNEWVDSRIYSDPQIFEEELEKIFKKTWIPVCHESELPNAYDFRTISIAREPVIVCRGRRRSRAMPSCSQAAGSCSFPSSG